MASVLSYLPGETIVIMHLYALFKLNTRMTKSRDGVAKILGR